MKDVYWKKMFRFRYQIYYLYCCYRQVLWTNRIVKIVSAFLSSSAIAAWASYANLAFLWGLIIVVSQVASVVYEFLPYKKRAEALVALINQYELLAIQVEKTWWEINMDESISDKEINNLIAKYETQWTMFGNKALGNDDLPQNGKFKTTSTKKAKEYFATNLVGVAENEKE